MRALAQLAWILFLAAPLAVSAAMATDDEAPYSQAELDQMLAPIALYPDTVLSHVLIAATYPLEVVQAARWSREHPSLQGAKAVDAVQDMDWDPSVKALVAFPEILTRMDEDLDWTERLGDAFLFQEAQVMDSVQHLRDRAYDAGHLDSLEHVRVIREREVIYIEPAISHIVYLPYYDPWYVYGAWWWPSYPPYCWSYWYGRPVGYYATGFYWGIGFHVAPTFYFSSFQWHNHQVVVVNVHQHTHPHHFSSGREVAQHRDARRWGHDPHHRHGVAHRSERVREQHGERQRHQQADRDTARRDRHESAEDQRDVQRVQHESAEDQRDVQRVQHENRRAWGPDSGRPDRARAENARHQRGRPERREASRPETRSEPAPATRQDEARPARRGSRWAPSDSHREPAAERAERREGPPARTGIGQSFRGEGGHQRSAPPESRGSESARVHRAEPARGDGASREAPGDSAREHRGNRGHGNEPRGRSGANGEERERGSRRGRRAER